MPSRLDGVLKLEVPLIVQIAERSMRVRDVVNLAPGSIVELPKCSEEELEILANNKAIGFGTAVKVGENFGVRVTFIGSLKDRIRALGGEEAAASPAAEERADHLATPEPETASA